MMLPSGIQTALIEMREEGAMLRCFLRVLNDDGSKALELEVGAILIAVVREREDIFASWKSAVTAAGLHAIARGGGIIEHIEVVAAHGH